MEVSSEKTARRRSVAVSGKLNGTPRQNEAATETQATRLPPQEPQGMITADSSDEAGGGVDAGEGEINADPPTRLIKLKSAS